MSTSQKFSPIYIPFAAYALLLLAQWPTSTLIQKNYLTLGILLNEWVVIMGLSLLIWKKWPVRFSSLFPFRKITKPFFFQTVVMTLALVIVIDYLTFLSEKIWAPSPEIEALLEKIIGVASLSDGLWRWSLICLTPAFCEEFFFRGFFQNTIQHHWGKKLSLVLSATLFALIHGIPAYWHLYFILGIYMGWLLLISRNLWLPILAHLINNSWTFLTHISNSNLPHDKVWHPVDSLIMLAALAVFALSSFRFRSQQTI